MREFITGNQAVVRGALRAGCDYFAGYPITPASSILGEFIGALAGGGGVAIQTGDEIAAIGQCIGAAMAGARAMTASSGPGLSLCSESIGLAQMGEVPLVIVDCQRMGPATGGATRPWRNDRAAQRPGLSWASCTRRWPLERTSSEPAGDRPFIAGCSNRRALRGGASSGLAGS